MKLRNLKLSRLIHWLIYSAGFFVFLCAVIIGLASTSWFRHVLQHRIESSLSELTGGKVEIEGMGFRPLELRISARRLVIHGLEKDSSHPLFSAENVVVNVSPETLVHFRLVLKTLEWQQADLRVRTYKDGSTNIPGTTVSPAKGQGVADLLDLGIERLVLTHSTLYWNNQRIPLEASARNLAIQLHISQDHHFLGTIASSAAVFNWKSRKLPPLSFDTQFKLSSSQVEVPALTWQIANLRGHIAGSLSWTPQLAGNFEFRTRGGLQELARALKLGSLERGYLYVDGKGTYDKDGFSVKGRMQARELTLKTARFKPGSLSLAADYQLTPDKKLKLANVTLAALQGRANGEATVSFEKPAPHVALQCRFRKVNLKALMNAVPGLRSTIGIFHPKAIISGTVSTDWRALASLQSHFDVQLQPPAHQKTAGLPLGGQAQGSFHLDHTLLLTLNKAQITTPHSGLQAQGTFGTTRSSLSVKFTTTDFEEWRPLAEILIETKSPLAITLHSRAFFDGTVSGTFSNPEIEGQMTAGSFTYGGWVWDSIQAGILASPQRVRIQSARLKLGKSSLALNAEASLFHWKLEPSSAVRLQATAQETPLAGLRAALNLKPSMEGLLTGRVQAEGTVEDLSGHGKLAIHKGEFVGLPFDSLSANVVASKSAWKVNNLELIEGNGRANGNLEIDPVQRTFSANLAGKDFPLEEIHFLKPQKKQAKGNAELSGLVGFDVEGKGSFDNAQVHSTVDITKLAWQGQSLGSIQGHAEWQGKQIKLQIKGGNENTGNFQASGSMETRGDWPLHLSGQYSNFRADPWIEEFSGHQMAAEVSASGSFQVNGPVKEKNQVVGSGQIQSLQINFPSLKLSNAAPVEISYAKRNLTFKRFRLQGESTNFEVGGSVHFGRPPSLDLSANGRAAATLMSLVASNIQATGESVLQVRLRGSLAEPQLSGEVQVKDVGLGYSGLPFRLNALNGTIKLEGERAVVSTLKGNIGGGAVNIGGFIVLQEGLRYQVRADLSQVRVRYPTDFTSVLDGRLILAGNSTQGQLSGNISVRNVFANENLSLVNFISGSGNLLGLPSPGGTPSPFASRISLNVRLASLRPLRIETHNLRLVSDVDLHLQGTLANPVAVGNIYLRSGQAIFRGNRYTLTRGDIAMTNPFRTEPVVDMQVHTQIDKYDLTLEVSGPPDQIRFSYRSDPPLPTEDILSLLAFGYSKRLQEFAPETKNPFSSASASALLSQALSSQVSGRIQRLFGVSRIKLSPTTGEVGTLGGPVLTVEQQLSSDLTLTYQTSTANSLYRVIEFDWTVNPRMSVRGFRDQNGIFGLELKFRKRFK